MTTVDKQTLPDTADSVQIATLSEEEMAAFIGDVMENMMIVLQDAQTKLPESVLMMINSLI